VANPLFEGRRKNCFGWHRNHHSQAVHGFRPTTRRLETLLAQLVRDGSRKNKKLLKMLNRIRKSAGRVRDVDVQLQALGSLKIPPGATAKDTVDAQPVLSSYKT
jgi:CHAD domain-containing protein